MCATNEDMINSIYIKIEIIYLTWLVNHCIFAVGKTMAYSVSLNKNILVCFNDLYSINYTYICSVYSDGKKPE